MRVLMIALVAMFLLGGEVRAQYRDLPVPSGHVLDMAGLLDAELVAALELRAAALHEEENTPVIVFTIDAMADYTPRDLTIEQFAGIVYENWGYSPLFPFTETWRDGVLVLVSKADRKARIEFGATWAGDSDREAAYIMDNILVPAFKGGDFGAGLNDGLDAIAALARGESLGSGIAREWYWIGGIIAFFAALLLLAILLDRYKRLGDATLTLVDILTTPLGGTVTRGTPRYSVSSYFTGGSRSGSYGTGGGFWGGGGGGFGGGSGASGSW